MLLADKVHDLLSNRLVGQPHVIQPIADAVLVAEAGMTPEERCAGAFLLMGPTGVGKTETVRLVAEALHGDRHKVLKIDCAEFQAEHEIAKLIGAPPGYIGHKESPGMLHPDRLAEAASEHCSYTVLLFDEVEKAHASLHRLLLGMMEGPTLLTGGKATANFHRTFIFMTSNLSAGDHAASKERQTGFDGGNRGKIGRPDYRYEEAARKFFAPEFMARLDGFRIYHELPTTELRALVEQEITLLAARVPRKRFSIVATAEARERLLKEADTARYGGREIRNVLHKEVGIPLARQIATGVVGLTAYVSISQGEIAVKVSNDYIFAEVA